MSDYFSSNYASVTGGWLNRAVGFSSSISGGQANLASGIVASVSGGVVNHATGQLSSILGGDDITLGTGNGTYPAGP